MQRMEFIELDVSSTIPHVSWSGKDYDILIMFLGPGSMDKLGSWIRTCVLNFPLAPGSVSNDI